MRNQQPKEFLLNLFYLFSLAVLMEAINTLLISKQSFKREFPISSVIYSDIASSLSQYSVSAASFSEIWSLEIRNPSLDFRNLSSDLTN